MLNQLSIITSKKTSNVLSHFVTNGLFQINVGLPPPKIMCIIIIIIQDSVLFVCLFCVCGSVGGGVWGVCGGVCGWGVCVENETVFF